MLLLAGRMGLKLWCLTLLAALAVPVPAGAATPRETLMQAAFETTGRAEALARIDAAAASADALLARSPGDREARLQRALATGYRGKLTRSRGLALEARRTFEALAASAPRDPDIQLAIAGWHASAIVDLGAMMARTAVGARRAEAIAGLDRAVAFGRGHAAFPAMAALFRIAIDTDDVAAATALAEAALHAPAPDAFDRLMRQRAAAILPLLRSGNGARAAALARTLLPFARVSR